MAEPFKNLLNATLVGQMADHLARSAPDFDRAGFVSFVCAELDRLELRQRSARITEALTLFLPADFPAAAAILWASLHPEEQSALSEMVMDQAGIRGWAIMPMADYVAARGLGHLDLALDLLGEMTKRLTAEYAIRPLLLAEPERTLARMRDWALSDNPHLRRLASEGSRPRLPWGIRLRPFVEEPASVIALLELLRDDPSEYVRRSVANSLNDMAKDHPDLIAELAADWLRDATDDRRRLVSHACRTLVKQGHAGTLAALGFAAPRILLRRIAVVTPQVRFGEALVFEIDLEAEGTETQRLVLDYAIHHVKANGKTTPKVFKWQMPTLAPGQALSLCRKHPIRPITTRTYHDGTHAVEVFVNGVSLGQAGFELTGTTVQRVGIGTSPR